MKIHADVLGRPIELPRDARVVVHLPHVVRWAAIDGIPLSAFPWAIAISGDPSWPRPPWIAWASGLATGFLASSVGSVAIAFLPPCRRCGPRSSIGALPPAARCEGGWATGAMHRSASLIASGLSRPYALHALPLLARDAGLAEDA
jgi:hypothetical protein